MRHPRTLKEQEEKEKQTTEFNTFGPSLSKDSLNALAATIYLTT